jgi:rod shape determining protein RodA
VATSRRSAVPAGDLDKILIGLYLTLVGAGWFMIYSVNYDPERTTFGFLDLNNNAGKQMLFIVICFVLIFVIMLTEWSFWRTYALPVYLFSLVVLPGTLIFGREINGALAWYQFGGFSFQPSELAKFGTCLAMAGYLSSTGVDLREGRSRFFAFLIFLVPVVIILAQSDTGSALVFFSFLLVLFREGLPAKWYLIGGLLAASVILGLALEPAAVAALYICAANWYFCWRFFHYKTLWRRLWFFSLFLLLLPHWGLVFNGMLGMLNIDRAAIPLFDFYLLTPHVLLFLAAFYFNYRRKNSFVQKELLGYALLLFLSVGLAFAANFASNKLLAHHQQQRIKVWLRPSELAATDARGSAYNLLHSKMAIGSGGFIGKGFLEGNMTKLNYVPEQTTDFIFCTVGEEQGFFGVVLLIALFTAFLLRIVHIAERQRSNFSRAYAYGVAGIIFIHFFVNIGMTMGLFPIIGIPLPFLSYGGSSLIGFSLMIGVLLKLDSNRNAI